MLKTYFNGNFQLSVPIFTNILAIFLQHLFKIRMIPSPVKQKQTKTTQQQIQSHLEKVDVSRFPVVSNEATHELNSVAVNNRNEHSKIRPTAHCERLTKLVPVPPS